MMELDPPRAGGSSATNGGPMTAVLAPPEVQPESGPDLSGKKHRADKTFTGLALVGALSVLAILVLIAVSTTKEAWPIFQHDAANFLFTSKWAPNEGKFGSLAFVYGTIVTSIIALIFAVPVSIGIALFMTEVAPQWLRRPIVGLIDLLAVVPSVVFGLWGVLVLAQPIATFYGHVSDVLSPIPIIGKLFEGPVFGRSFFTAGIILAIMIVPIITSLTREVVATTPSVEKEAAYGLGSTRWEMIRGAVFPHSKGGIVGAVTLGLGRAMGETIAVALVIGSNPQITAKLFQPGYSMAAVIANEFGESSGLWRAALIGLGVLLFAITIVVNVAAKAIVNRSMRKSRGA
jgi:phosphate transport system permease protein